MQNTPLDKNHMLEEMSAFIRKYIDSLALPNATISNYDIMTFSYIINIYDLKNCRLNIENELSFNNLNDATLSGLLNCYNDLCGKFADKTSTLYTDSVKKIHRLLDIIDKLSEDDSDLSLLTHIYNMIKYHYFAAILSKFDVICNSKTPKDTNSDITQNAEQSATKILEDMFESDDAIRRHMESRRKNLMSWKEMNENKT